MHDDDTQAPGRATPARPSRFSGHSWWWWACAAIVAVGVVGSAVLIAM